MLWRLIVFDPHPDRRLNFFTLCLSPISLFMLFAYYIHQLSPYIVRFTDKIGLHWYGFAYVLAFLCGGWLYQHLARKGYGELPPEKVTDFITLTAIFGVMLGGRLGWILFYGYNQVLANPLTAFKLWEGGMASHGGFLGVFFFLLFYARWQKVSWPGLGDNLVVVVPIGLFFVRIANFVNGELWGRIITSPNPPAWAMRFPKALESPDSPLDPQTTQELVAGAYAHDPVALKAMETLAPLRHPSQLYEAGLEGLFLFALMWVMRTRMRTPVGMLTGVFFIAYAAVRIFAEQFREPDFGIPLTWGLTRGQFLSLFMFIIGGGFVAYSLVTRHYQLPGMRRARPSPDAPAAAASTAVKG